MDRRSFLQVAASTAAALAISLSPGKAGGNSDRKLKVMTVRGPIDAGEMGFTLTHEHVIADVRSIQEQIANPAVPDADEVVDVVLPHLERIREFGCRTLIDATAVGIGRHAAVVRRLSEESGLQMLCTTGAYAAADYRFLPPYVRAEAADALAARWIDEARHGIEGEDVRPGFIKLSVNGGPLSEIELKLIRAGAIAHLETGLTIGVHTRLAAAAFEQLAFLEEAGVHPSAWIWIHAQEEPDPAQLIKAAERGAWISLDGVAPDTVAAHVEKTKRMREEDLLGRVLVSQDAGWYTVGEPRGGDFRSFDTCSRASFRCCGRAASARARLIRSLSAIRRKHSPSESAATGEMAPDNADEQSAAGGDADEVSRRVRAAVGDVAGRTHVRRLPSRRG